jgi:D-sedoheptulose 7-phosphate isomerase
MTLRANDYFQKVYGFLTSTQVTDKNGNLMTLDDGGDQAAQMILGLLATSNKAMVIGNGGSAAIASHTHNDLCKAVGAPALVFTETPLLTALTNDNGYNVAFAQQIALWAKPGDLLIAISSSGCSENILHAVQEALLGYCHVITLSGFQADNPLRFLGNINFYTPVEDYGFVESAHAVLLHYLTDLAITLKTKQTR